MQLLTTYARHPRTGYPEALSVADVALPAGVRPPSAGLVCLFGKTAVAELAKQRRAAETTGEALTTIQIVVDADDSVRDFARPPDLQTAEFLQLSNMSGETLALIIARMEAAAKTMRTRFEPPMRGGMFTTRQLHLLTAVFADPYFAKLHLVTTRLPEPAGTLGWMTVAILLSAEKVGDIQARRYTAADVLLPDKLPLTRALFETRSHG